MYVIMRRARTIISHDPQRRCYDGHLNKAEVVWTAWSELERWPDTEVAERRLKFWRELNDYAVSQRGKGDAWEFKLEEVK